MPKQKSRTARWMEAVDQAKQQMDVIRGAADDLAAALTDLRDVQTEYEDWRDNLPENLQSSTLADKLNTVCDIDIESYTTDPLENWGEVERALDEAEGADMPLGFGRD